MFGQLFCITPKAKRKEICNIMHVPKSITFYIECPHCYLKLDGKDKLDLHISQVHAKEGAAPSSNLLKVRRQSVVTENNQSIFKELLDFSNPFKFLNS